MSKKKLTQYENIAQEQYEEGLKLVTKHPMFSGISSHTYFIRDKKIHFSDDGWAFVCEDGKVYVHPTRRGTPKEWQYVIAHCLLHLAFMHFDEKYYGPEWNAACDTFIGKFLYDFKLGTPPTPIPLMPVTGFNNEHKIYNNLLENHNEKFYVYGVNGNERDMVWDQTKKDEYPLITKRKWDQLFAIGLQNSVTAAINIASGKNTDIYGVQRKSLAQSVKDWFISNYPLLGALASSFKLIEDPFICQSQQITVAAINTELGEIYINPACNLTQEELKFVTAHEFLHSALCHEQRRQGRDPQIWNVACDFIINDWLIQMHLGDMPQGLLYDVQFKGLSAESVYDRIVTDMRTYRKLATLRGVGLGDILGDGTPWWESGIGVNLDNYYKSAISQGLEYHLDNNRGYLPLDMVEEIRSLSHPPIPWDVQLAKWFDNNFAPIDKIRTYSRISRRQSSTPDIPRPAWKYADTAFDGRTLAVLLDTSGSMNRFMLAKALGAIASYCAEREVHEVRVIYCDAQAYDQGMMRPEDIAGTVKVRGRGGTILQRGIDLIENDNIFPKDAPLLVITDGMCDVLHFKGREHAFLMPQGSHLPFVPKGKVFSMNLD